MKSASLATSSYALFAYASILRMSSGQYDWDCNTTNSMVFTQYSDGSCGQTNADPIYSITYWESSDTYDLFQCDQDTACDYAVLRYYADEDCSDDLHCDRNSYVFKTTACDSSTSGSGTSGSGSTSDGNGHGLGSTKLIVMIMCLTIALWLNCFF